MPSDTMAQLKLGFYLGMGIVIALTLWSFLQLLLFRAVKRNGG